MSQLLHDSKKFADTGLQLRLPVDLVPATQYSRLTNCLALIEGELTAREGMISLGNVSNSTFVAQLSGNVFGLNSATTVNPHGLTVGMVVILDIAYSIGDTGIVPGAYTVTVLTVPTSTQFTFSPSITTTGVTTAFIFGEVVASSALTTLTNTAITNIFRLNQAVTSLPTERLVCINGRVYQSSLSTGLQWEELVGPIAPGGPIPTAIMGFSGGPMAIVAFRFTLDSASWAIFADGSRMYKYRPGITESQIEFVPLGNAVPTAAATATAGGTGNLNSTGGTGYDWRYTYVDGLALTEGNPSPINMSSGGTSTLRPTAFNNPASTSDTAFLNPTSAFDTSTTTGSAGTASASAEGQGQSQTVTASCQWKSWAPAAGSVTAITLNVLASLEVDSSNDGGGSATATATISFSYDGGVTFQQLTKINVNGNNTISTGIQTYSAVIPSSVSLTNIIVKAVGVATARGATIGGDIFGGSSNANITVYDINTSVTQSGSVNTLALVNKIGLVCVTPSTLPQHTFINLYRRGGSLPDAWRLVGQFQVSTLSQGGCGAGTLLISDNVSDTTLSTSTILLLDNNQPVQSVTATNQALSFIWGPVGIDVRLLGCGDPARPESVYFSKPGNADSWPPQNFIEVSDPGTPIVAGCVYNTRSFAFSREHIYELVEGLGTGATYTPFRTPSAHGLFTPWGLAVGPAMFFIAKDGIYASTGGVDQSIVENDIKPLFPTYDTPGQAVNGYEAIDYTQPNSMRLTYHNDELFFEYIGTTTGTRQILVYDILKKRWRGMDTSCGISTFYSEPNTVSSLLYGTVAGSVYQAGGAVDPTELDIIENTQISTTVVPSTFTTANYYFRLVRLASTGAVATSYETILAMTALLSAQVVVPTATSGTTGWQVWVGTSGGGENKYFQFNEPLSNRTLTITSPTGTTGVFPTVNSNSSIQCLLRTGAHDQGAPLNQKQYGNVLFDVDPGGATVGNPVTITPYLNGEVSQQAALTVTGTGRQQVPLTLTNYFAFNTEYEVAWTRNAAINPSLFQYDTLHFIEPVQVTSWVAQPTSFSFPGFVHVRDVYVAIRSTAAVTFTVVIDGTTTLTYTIPSTGGKRLKHYVQLDSNKGLMYQFSLTAATSFRTYEEDFEIRVKPFLGILGYQILRPLGGEANA